LAVVDCATLPFSSSKERLAIGDSDLSFSIFVQETEEKLSIDLNIGPIYSCCILGRNEGLTTSGHCPVALLSHLIVQI
jgi:hypothetical protein